MYGGNVVEFAQQYNTEAEVVFHNRDMEVEKELTKLCVSKNNELKENETNARVVIRSKNVKRSIIEELLSNDNHVVKEGDNKTSPILDPPCAKSKKIFISRLNGHLEKRKSRASQLHKP
ncbi:hypothetical protein Gohar_021784, partial [Gossypium harknessii]|nr:hypothetical protein [Gossypium harknessii]